ncbi:Sorting and assembly machinery component 50-A-like protein [Rhynchospora pubera]|uniref:Sorting and assembly machinery component 50-A-like protein n=1 Tax=Rhynchospora pubera TaxID=906938 RepID=A0AAV8EFP8_9POAL|nr:Sorting and assembly machinery component 50-A-like protein [Rhynchospora pubera]
MSPPSHSDEEQGIEAEEEDDDGDPTDSETIPSLLRRLAASPVPIKVRSVQINNSSRTKRELIESVLDQDSILKSSTLQELVYVAGLANARLKRLGVFRSVRITIDAGPDDVPGSSMVVVDVAEAVHPFAGDFFVDCNTEWEFQEYAWLLGSSIKLKNLLGYADIWDISTSYGWDQVPELSVGLTLPFIKYIPSPLVARISLFPQEWFNVHSYKDRLVGLSFGLISTLNHNLSYDLSWRVLSDPTRIQPHSIKQWLSNGMLNSMKYTYNVDMRDSVVRPTCGYAFFSSSQIGFSPTNWRSWFFRQEFDLRAAFPLNYLKSSLNLGVSAGLITPFGKEITDLPPNMAYKFHFSTTSPTSRLGGLSLFGFKPKGSTLLETSSSDANGGDIAVTAFADLSFDLPMKFLREKGVYGHAFVNAGNVVRLKENDWKKLSFVEFLDTCRSSAGFGFVLPTKIFRLEINYCYILKQFQNDGGKTGIQLNFSSP